MAEFGEYAKYYDLLYGDKDYTGDARFIRRLVDENAPGARAILELGCGTGRHACLLASKGFAVHGVDVSSDMLNIANERRLGAVHESYNNLCFTEGDIRSIRLGEKFDAVLSLFHVISYQTTNDDLSAAFETARFHLKPGGIFIFDIWYGPAVLTDPPTVRAKRIENDKFAITRIADPLHHPDKCRVDVKYSLNVKIKETGKEQNTEETHRMRYFFRPEIEFALEKRGLQIIEHKEWLTKKDAGNDTWGTYFIAKH